MNGAPSVKRTPVGILEQEAPPSASIATEGKTAPWIGPLGPFLSPLEFKVLSLRQEIPSGGILSKLDKFT